MSVGTVAKKKKPQEETSQVNIRFPLSLLERLDNAADGLGIDRTSLMKLIIKEKLPEYERRAKEASGEE